MVWGWGGWQPCRPHPFRFQVTALACRTLLPGVASPRCITPLLSALPSSPPPGSVENDFWLALDLLQSKKEHAEFTIVRDWVYEVGPVCVGGGRGGIWASTARGVRNTLGRTAINRTPAHGIAGLARHLRHRACGREEDGAEAGVAAAPVRPAVGHPAAGCHGCRLARRPPPHPSRVWKVGGLVQACRERAPLWLTFYH